MSQKRHRPTVDPLLQALRREGWTERRAEKFENAYGQKLRWRVIGQMEKLGLVNVRVSPESVHCLSNRRLELYENVLSDLWAELLAGLVTQYLERVEQGKVSQAFIAYMTGVVRNLVIKNARRLGLLSEESPTELVVGICEAKEERTRRNRVARVKYFLEHRVRSELLMRCPSEHFAAVYTNIHHVSDYFFEAYIPAQCGELRWGGNVLASLLERFSEVGGELDRAAAYCGRVAPYARSEEVSLESLEGEGDAYIAGLGQDADQGWV